MPKLTLFKRILISIAIFTGIVSIVHAQVDEDELQNLPPVVFINYVGPHARIDTREQIRQIGVVLGQDIYAREMNIISDLEAMSTESRRDYSYTFQSGALNRYFIIHSVSGPEANKLDADIFGLGVDAGVDHIRNLRTIIQGYLQEAYDYSERDSAVLAEFITVYNAVYRGNWEFFTSRYKTPVIEYLTSEKAGLSIRYDEWPGRTLILIPLGHSLSSVDISAISDRRVIEELRREEDQGVPQRQEMVELKEREADRAEQQVQAELEAIRQEERQITEGREQAAQEKQQVTEDLKTGTITEEEARQRQTELDETEQELDRREDNLDQRREDAQRLEEYAEKIFDEAQQERRDIAGDQQNQFIRETAGVQQETELFGITIEHENPSSGRLVRFNPVTGERIRTSPLDTVHARTVSFVNKKIIAIAGDNINDHAVRIVEINPVNLDMVKQGDDDIKTGSLLWVNDGDLYAITVDLESNSCFLGRFNENLTLMAKSSVKVHPEASVTIQQGRLFTQNEDGSVLILNPANLFIIY
jgi:hypothetical protein